MGEKVYRELRREAKRLATYEYANTGITAEEIYKHLKNLWKKRNK